MSDIQEIVFYIHGVSSAMEGSNHQPQYHALHEGIGAHSDDPSWPTDVHAPPLKKWG